MSVPALTPPSPAGAPRYSWYPDNNRNMIKLITRWDSEGGGLILGSSFVHVVGFGNLRQLPSLALSDWDLVYNNLPQAFRPYKAGGPSGGWLGAGGLAEGAGGHSRHLPGWNILDIEQLFSRKVQGCHFHFCQAVVCSVQAHAELSRLSQRDTSDTCKFVLAQFFALAFLKPEHSAQGFEILSKDPYTVKHPEFRLFLEYFEPQWIGKVVTQRKGKTRAKAIWNVYWAAVNGKLKTTLAIEVYHKHLKANSGLHPKFNKFFHLL
ncbi:hypothetical protein DSO57_1008290 [Entomophthora muscae]|uniref:Uncharacterized protein n=1 Tax=Entomophthora muscae TaxID=34485 RepID=A0ACC2US09_9FUNG|nr:hypothetical protein DSO57_1008290 [Entomophthora muscae]